MTIKVVTDSTCDLPASLAAQHDITVIPAYINVGGRSYLDGVDLTRQQFYEALPTFTSPPTTAAPASGAFAQTYRNLAAAGADQILSLHVAGSLSGMLNAARLGSEEAADVPVTLFDSGQLSMGLGWLAVTAAQAARAGHTMAEITALLRQTQPRTHVFALLDTLEFLRRSGRVNWAQFGLGSLLNIKPIVKMHQSVLDIERIRTYRRAWQRLLDMLAQAAPLSHLAIVHTHAQAEAEALRAAVKNYHPADAIPPLVEVTPAIGSHIGPGAVGFACIRAA
ncbi:MAG: DegV family protein [Candidatus Promineifilaceae bacterium]